MANPQVLYEAKLAKEGRKLTFAWLVVSVLWLGAGVVFCFHFDSFPHNSGALGIFALGALIFALHTVRVFRLSRNPGVYRISIDDYGRYVQSDDPSSAPSFSIVATDLHRLVRITSKGSESGDERQYYVETKSGTRHRIEQLFTDYDLDAMKLFERITDRFHWVEIVEEEER